MSCCAGAPVSGACSGATMPLCVRWCARFATINRFITCRISIRGGAQAVSAPFFGVPTPTLTALARIARLADAVVLPCYTRKLPGVGGFEVTIGPALTPFPTDDALADAARMNAAIEEGVRMMPEQYLWTYKRFKRVRRDGRSPYE